MTTTAK